MRGPHHFANAPSPSVSFALPGPGRLSGPCKSASAGLSRLGGSPLISCPKAGQGRRRSGHFTLLARHSNGPTRLAPLLLKPKWKNSLPVRGQITLGLKKYNQMKSKSIVLSLAGLLVSGLMTLAQSAAPATDTNQPATATAAPVTNAVDATATAVPATNTPDASAAPAATNAPDMSATNAPATNAAAAPATNAPEAAAPAATPAPAEVTASPAAAPVVGASNGPPDMSAVIPLIQMEDVPLTDAIKNLARQAGLNYMLDPKINYGAPGPDGRPIPQPTVSLRWENLTPDQALNAVLNNYNLTIVDDARTHTARITIKDPAAPDPLVTKIIQLKYAYATNLVTNVKSILQDKRSNVLPDARTSQLIVVATEKEMDTVDDLIARLDTPTKQVLIEARLIKTSKNPTTAKGVDWTGTLSQQHITFGNGNTTGSVLTGAASTAGNTAGNVAGTAVGAVGPPFTGSPTPAGPASGSSSGTTSLSSSTSALTTARGVGRYWSEHS